MSSQVPPPDPMEDHTPESLSPSCSSGEEEMPDNEGVLHIVEGNTSSSIPEPDGEIEMHINHHFAGGAEGEGEGCIPPHELEDVEPEHEQEDEMPDNRIVNGFGALNLEGDDNEGVNFDIEFNVWDDLQRIAGLGWIIHQNLLRNGLANPPIGIDDDEDIGIIDQNPRRNVQRAIQRVVNRNINNGLYDEHPRDQEQFPIVNRIDFGNRNYQAVEIRIDEPAPGADYMPALEDVQQPVPEDAQQPAPEYAPQLALGDAQQPAGVAAPQAVHPGAPQVVLQVAPQPGVEVMRLNVPHGEELVPERVIPLGPPPRMLMHRHVIRPVPRRAAQPVLLALPEPAPQVMQQPAAQPAPEPEPEPEPEPLNARNEVMLQVAPQPGIEVMLLNVPQGEELLPERVIPLGPPPRMLMHRHVIRPVPRRAAQPVLLALPELEPQAMQQPAAHPAPEPEPEPLNARNEVMLLNVPQGEELVPERFIPVGPPPRMLMHRHVMRPMLRRAAQPVLLALPEPGPQAMLQPAAHPAPEPEPEPLNARNEAIVARPVPQRVPQPGPQEVLQPTAHPAPEPELEPEAANPGLEEPDA